MAVSQCPVQNKTGKYFIFQIWLKNGKRALDIDYYKDKHLADIVQLDDPVILNINVLIQ
jgi:hypothetical protein